MMHLTHNSGSQILRRSQTGSATMLALFMLALLSFIGATVLIKVGRLYNGNEQVQGWQEALYAAEMGADIGLANVRWTVATPPTGITAFATASGWVTTTSANNTTYTYTTPTLTQGGEGTVQTWAVVTVDSPVGSNSTSPPTGLTDSSGRQWYRIRSTGHARLSGMARVSTDILSDPNARHNNTLRKFSLRKDRATGATLTSPEATRTIEQILKPVASFTAAVLANTQLSISGTQVIDSYDSSDSTKSTNGKYVPGKRQNNGDVVYNGSSSKGLTIASGEKVYGDAGTNGAGFTDPNKTIQSPGTINNSMSVNLPIIPIPTWGMSGSPSINNSVTTVTTAQTITVDSNAANNYYKIATITAPLSFAFASGVSTGTVNIWLTGDVNTKGAITIPKGVSVNIYFTGGTFHPGQNGSNVGAIDNLNQDPSTFTIYGCGTLTGSGPGIDLHVGGTGVQNFYGTVYAPYRTLNLKYDGTTNYDLNSAHFGSFVGDTINLKSSVHYDEAAGSSIVSDYKRASYVEDTR